MSRQLMQDISGVSTLSAATVVMLLSIPPFLSIDVRGKFQDIHVALCPFLSFELPLPPPPSISVCEIKDSNVLHSCHRKARSLNPSSPTDRHSYVERTTELLNTRMRSLVTNATCFFKIVCQQPIFWCHSGGRQTLGRRNFQDCRGTEYRVFPDPLSLRHFQHRFGSKCEFLSHSFSHIFLGDSGGLCAGSQLLPSATPCLALQRYE